MTLIDTINYYINTIFFVSIFILCIVGGLTFYFLKIKKVTAKVEKINYDSFDRTDSLEYIKFDDIIAEDTENLNSPAIIAVGKNTFVAGLSIMGYNNATASIEKQQRTMLNAVSFSNIVEKPIQLRQTVRSVDLSHNIEVHEELLHKAVLKHMSLKDELEETTRLAEDYIDMPEEFEKYEKRINRLQRMLMAARHRVEELKALIEYMNLTTNGAYKETSKIHQIMFSWTYNPDEYTEELSNEEIELKAMQELATQANIYNNAYVRCGYSCSRLSKSDLIMLMYRHIHPVTGDAVTTQDLFDSSYDALFVTSDSLIDIECQRRDEEAFKRRLKEAMEEQEEYVRQKSAAMERSTQLLWKEVTEQVDKMEVRVG